MSTILLLHPGEMGASLGAALSSNDHDVLWVSSNRSAATRTRAENANLSECNELTRAVRDAEILISVCPPEFALPLANDIREFDFEGIYVDANAVSPNTAASIANTFRTNYVDGGIIGPPALKPNTTRLYLSGMHAPQVQGLFADTTVGAHVLTTEQATSASALKMCYASYTKGTSALVLAIRAVAEHHGITEALFQEWRHSQPDLQQRSERTGPGTSRKGWRFAAEMREIAATFAEAGLSSGFHLAAADVYERMACFKDRPPASTEEVINQLLYKDA